MVDFDLWRYGDEKPRPKREETVARLVAMLEGLLKTARKEKRKLAPVIGIACPGVIAPDGSILSGAQNLPGNWEKSDFNLGERLMSAIPTIAGHETQVLIHNDAVVQGLCEAPFMRDVKRWGVITIGTGLGNARFTNRAIAGNSRRNEDRFAITRGDHRGRSRARRRFGWRWRGRELEAAEAFRGLQLSPLPHALAALASYSHSPRPCDTGDRPP